MDTSTIESVVNSVVDPVKGNVTTIAVAALGIFAIVFGLGFIPKLIKRFGNK